MAISFSLCHCAEDLYSQSALFRPRLRAFSETARLTVSLAPSGNSAEISSTTRTAALGSLFRTMTISSAIWTRRILAVAAGTSAVAWNDFDFAAPAVVLDPPGTGCWVPGEADPGPPGA